MNITAIKTHKITVSDTDLFTILDKYLPDSGPDSVETMSGKQDQQGRVRMTEGCVLAVTSKIVAICEGRVAPASADKDELIISESEYYLPRELNRYQVMVTINDHVIAAAAGIDESNVETGYVLWPIDVQESANKIREHLKKRFGLNEVGVVITDSKTTPLRWGVTGIGLAHSGFAAINDYIGTPDLFGREMHVTKVNVMDGLSASAVYAMGEGKEQTPLAVISDIPHIQFQDRNPTREELDAVYLELDEDLYGQMIKYAPWKKGKKSA